jgi:aromatic-L-amino-acid decarboxylase
VETKATGTEAQTQRDAPVDLTADEFRALGHRLIDQIADLIGSMRTRRVTTGKPQEVIRDLVGSTRSLPDRGVEPREILSQVTNKLIDHSLYNSHPRFWGYITAPSAPLGILGDLLAAGVNPNCGSCKLSPVANEIENQAIRWIAELIGFPAGSGIMVSGGNMANFVPFLAARVAKAGPETREQGINHNNRLKIYASAEAHTWIHKAADLFGHGTDAISWIRVDSTRRMDVSALRAAIEADQEEGNQPFIVVGTAGTVSTGAIDPLPQIAQVCREYDLWFHIDGAYGGFAAAVPEVHDDIRGLSLADSVAVDPHKWLYSPLEAGCALVRDPDALRNAFSYHPSYYHFDTEMINYVDLGMQNSRGFRALKVWLLLQQAGRDGYVQMIRDDINLAAEFHRLAKAAPDLEAFSHNLSITTFRYVPSDLRDRVGETETEAYLNDLNREILVRLETGGEAFVSNAVVNDKFLLRLCVCNFRTTQADIEAFPAILTRIGTDADHQLRNS